MTGLKYLTQIKIPRSISTWNLRPHPALTYPVAVASSLFIEHAWNSPTQCFVFAFHQVYLSLVPTCCFHSKKLLILLSLVRPPMRIQGTVAFTSHHDTFSPNSFTFFSVAHCSWISSEIYLFSDYYHWNIRAILWVAGSLDLKTYLTHNRYHTVVIICW